MIEMIEIVILWLILCFFSFGSLGLYFILMKKVAKKNWDLKIDKNYLPKVSIVVPTYNESDIINFKLENLHKLNYPKNLIQIILVDSNSNDNTIALVSDFIKRCPRNNIKVLIEKERKGKSAALNFALKHCDGDIIVVSDADCFYPAQILYDSLPFLADPQVGAISGSKILLNPKQSWTTKTEDLYLNSINLIKLGESKLGSTLFFEGGFSAYKREVLESFDPYDTGSDDCGTIIRLAERNFRAIYVPEAYFYTPFPVFWKGKISIKIRRSNQIVRVLWRYFSLLVKGRIKCSRLVIIYSFFNYIIGPILFIPLVIVTTLLLFNYPYFALFFLLLVIPKVRSYFIEVIQNYIFLELSILAAVFGKKFLIWKKPADRVLLKEEMLRQYNLI